MESSRTMLACNGNFGRRNWKAETRRKYRGVNRVNSVHVSDTSEDFQ